MSFERPQYHNTDLIADADNPGARDNAGQKAARLAEIQNWLISRLAELLRVSPDEVDVQEPFANFGLNSIDAVSLSGDLEDLLGRNLSATLLWDFPTIETLSNYLVADTADDTSVAT
jgi:acyl carrier protein